MTTEELLLQLKDIQPPPEPAWWLVAPVYPTLLLTLVVLAGCAVLLRRHRRAARLSRIAERDFERIRSAYINSGDLRELALNASCWLKQVAMLAYPERQLDGACGEAWLEFLDRELDDGRFTHGCGRLFGGAVYASDIEVDATELIALCERWLAAVKPRLQRKGDS